MKDSKDRVRKMLQKQNARIKEETEDTIKFIPDLNEGFCPPVMVRIWDICSVWPLDFMVTWVWRKLRTPEITGIRMIRLGV